MKSINERDGFDLVMDRYLGISNQPHAEMVAQEGTRIVFSREGFMRIYTPKKVEWTGEGLPPVGVLIEMKHKRATSEWARPDFYEEQLAWVGREHFVTVDEKFGYLSDYLFRSIRTPEQIAAEERVKACQEWLKGIEEAYGQEVADKCEDILMEGEKRKQVKP